MRITNEYWYHISKETYEINAQEFSSLILYACSIFFGIHVVENRTYRLRGCSSDLIRLIQNAVVNCWNIKCAVNFYFDSHSIHIAEVTLLSACCFSCIKGATRYIKVTSFILIEENLTYYRETYATWTNALTNNPCIDKSHFKIHNLKIIKGTDEK